MIRRRLTVILLAIVLLVSFVGSNSFACDEEQTNSYLPQILFGDYADSKSSNENVQMLLAAVYLCCEQCDDQGQDKIDYLKKTKVSGVPSRSAINIKNEQLLECSHIKWDAEYPAAKKSQANRKKVLRNTVNKVFDFGFFNNLFGSKKGKCDSFAALLYYSHILSDYIADDPSKTDVVVNGKQVPAFSGDPSVIINGDKPRFTSVDLNRAKSFTYLYEGTDNKGRAGTVLAVVGPSTLEEVSYKSVSDITPPGWKQKSYDWISGYQSADLYNRSHLLARSMGGANNSENLVTGTNYMNQIGMKNFEDKILKYIQDTGNHVLYRVSPKYEGNNLVCSGVQLEAYSIEDSGKGICFNRYCYNVQPGININYLTGDSWQSDSITGSKNAIPFAVNNPSDSNPDLIYEIQKYIEVLFSDQKDKSGNEYEELKHRIDDIARSARAISQPKNAGEYLELKKLQYKLLDELRRYVPKMLEKEDFFKKTFK